MVKNLKTKEGGTVFVPKDLMNGARYTNPV